MRLITLCAVIICFCAAAYSAEEKKEYTGNESIPHSSYTLRKSDTESSFGVILSPLVISINKEGFFWLGASADAEYYPGERIGFSVHGSKSYIVTGWDVDKYDFSTRGSYYDIDGGLRFNFIVTRMIEKVPVTLGSRLTGYNRTTVYYAMCNAPVRKTYALRAGYLRSAESYSVVSFDSQAGNYSSRRSADSAYGGFEMNLIYNVTVDINDAAVEREFGKTFSENKKEKIFADAIIPLRSQGNLDLRYPAGFRIGIISWGGMWGTGVRLEGGLHPAFGAYGTVELGISFQ